MKAPLASRIVTTMYCVFRWCRVAWGCALCCGGLLACAPADARSAVPSTAQAGTTAVAPAVPVASGSAGEPAVAGGAGPAADGGGGQVAIDAMAVDPQPPAAGTSGAAGAPPAIAGQPAAGSGMAGSSAAGAGGMAAPFALMPVGFPMAGDELTFPESANPPTNASPEFTWTGVPAGSKSLAVVFRDLGNDAIKWIIWDIPPSVTRLPPNISKVAMPSEVPGSSQLGSLDNQGYAGPGSGARQYDFKLWALDTAKLPVTRGSTTAQIHRDVLPAHDIAITDPVLVRNTRNLR
jgi:Raf kinase inhibitor-like YbhB/YbcL family protein